MPRSLSRISFPATQAEGIKTTDERLREQRAAARGHASVAERAGRQLTQDEKADRADYAVRNDGSVDALRSALAAVLEQLDAQFA